MTTERAVLAGGCFWGMQDMFRHLRGVLLTRVGYTGGDIPNPSYGSHQGHAEAIEIVFDPAVVSYRAVLEHFFQVHDPTTYEQQGSDFGPSYRSAIFYTDKQQKETALATIAEIEASGLWPGPVVTEINPEEPFWQAEPEHQDYLQRHPGGYSCHFVRPSWRLPSAHARQKSRTVGGRRTEPLLAQAIGQGRGSLLS
jgi:peptide-methionine (S)-S-oxide reductase